MSLYPAPVLHNNALNSVFNSSDFTTTNKLNSTNVAGPLTVSGLATFNGGTQVKGSEMIIGMLQANGGITTNNANINAGAGIITCGESLNIGAYGTSNLFQYSNGQLYFTNNVSSATSSASANAGFNFRNLYFNGTGNAYQNFLLINDKTDGTNYYNNNILPIYAGGGITMGTSSTLTLPSTQAITSGTTLIDSGSTQTVSGAKTFSTSLKTPMNTIINTSNDVVDTANTQTVSGAKTFSNNITLTSSTAPTTTGTQLGSTVSGTVVSTTAYTTATTLTVGSVVLANTGTYMVYGQGGIQCTTAGNITLAGVSLNTSAAINNTCLSQSAITAVVGYYPLQVQGTFSVSAGTTIYLVSNLTFATGAFSANQSYSALKAVRIA